MEQFINLITGYNLPIGDGIKPCTVLVFRSDVFMLGKHRLVFFDTPGFDDTTKSYADILERIGASLETACVEPKRDLQKHRLNISDKTTPHMQV